MNEKKYEVLSPSSRGPEIIASNMTFDVACLLIKAFMERCNSCTELIIREMNKCVNAGYQE